MSSSDEIIDHYSSSDNESGAIPVFRSSDLPPISIPPSLLPEETTDGYTTGGETDLASPSSTPKTSMTPGSVMESEFSFCNISSQTSYSTIATPSKPYLKKPYEDSPSASKRSKITRPSSEVFSDVSYPTPEPTYDIQVNYDGVLSTQELMVPKGNQIFNLEILTQVFALLVCPDRSCSGRPRLYRQLLQDGLQSFFVLKCKDCHSVIATFPSSLCIGMSASDCINNKGAIRKGKSEVNTRSMLAVHVTSSSYEDFRLTCSVLDLQVPSFVMSRLQLNKVLNAVKTTVEVSMKYCGELTYSASKPTSCSDPAVRECAVSFDASWHRRGHFSNQGFAAAIDAETGKVFDYQLYDRICYLCCKWSEERRLKNPDEYLEFWDTHKEACTANYKGSSQSMESSAAVCIWERSIHKHHLAYSVYIGDGDSSSYKNVLESDPYKGELTVRKEECLGHTQKRVKKHLTRKGKDGKGLPDRKADRIARLYGLVIIQNRGKTAIEIHNALQVLLDHLGEKHSGCPPGEGSWCYYQNRLTLIGPSDPLPQLRECYLKPEEMQRTITVFKTFGSLNFCGTITMGKTQNANESLHNMLWHNAPKAKHVGSKSLVASAAFAVLSFNEGSMSYSAVLQRLGITTSYSSLKYLSKRDHLRNLARERRIIETQKRRRRQIASSTNEAEKSRKRRDKKIYSSGGFGSEIATSGEESDTLCGKCQLRTCPIPARKSKSDNWIACHQCDNWFHFQCVGINSKKGLPEYYFCDNCKDS